MKSHFSISLWESLFIFFYTGVNIRAPWRELAFEHFVQAVVIKENMALVVWLKKNVGAVDGFAINNATVCAVYMRMSVSEGAGRGRAVFLSLELGYPLLWPHSVLRCPCVSAFGSVMSSNPGDWDGNRWLVQCMWSPDDCYLYFWQCMCYVQKTVSLFYINLAIQGQYDCILTFKHPGQSNQIQVKTSCMPVKKSLGWGWIFVSLKNTTCNLIFCQFLVVFSNICPLVDWWCQTKIGFWHKPSVCPT